MPVPYKVIAGPPVVAPPTTPEGSGSIPASGSGPKFTPGPWQWCHQDGLRGAYLATPNRGRLYVMDFVRKGMQHAAPRFAHWKGITEGTERERFGGIMEDGIMLKNGEMHPDARLIEAAPELLAAARDLLICLEEADETGYVDGEGWIDVDAVREKARAAINKALGQNTEPCGSNPSASA